jgi:hypothetical protein
MRRQPHFCSVGGECVVCISTHLAGPLTPLLDADGPSAEEEAKYNYNVQLQLTRRRQPQLYRVSHSNERDAYFANRILHVIGRVRAL